MRIVWDNRTHWREDHLRAFVREGVRRERVSFLKRGAAALKVKVRYNRGGNHRGGYVSGCAHYYSNTIQINLASQVVDKIDLAQTIVHELAHTAGITHDQMEGCPNYRRVGNWRELQAWAEALPLEKHERPSKRKPVSDRLAHAERMLARAQRRAKLATTIERKWKRRAIALRRTAMAPTDSLPLAAVEPYNKVQDGTDIH